MVSAQPEPGGSTMHIDTIPETLHPFFASQSFGTRFEIGGTEFEVQVRTPDLSACSASMWGDWGPMYTCELEPEQRVEITYRRVHDGRAARYVFSPPTMGVNSPMRTVERERCPFYIEFLDAFRSLEFQVHLSREGTFDHLVVERAHPALDFCALVFRPSPVLGSEDIANENHTGEALRSA